jgi:cytochrome c biogenesis protein CcdA
MRPFLLTGLILLLMSAVCGAGVSNVSRTLTPVSIDFFYETGCDSCLMIKREVVPELERRYAGLYELHEWDIGVPSNYLLLVQYQTRLGVSENEPVSLVVDDRIFLAGVSRITKRVYDVLEEALERRRRDEPPPLSGEPAPPASLLRSRLDSFTVMGLISAAAVDSLNPCAISTLVFFMSLLSVARIGVPRMWLAGTAFLMACYLTYLAIGFGLLKILEGLTALRGVRAVVESVVALAMLALAFLSFRDAFRFHLTGRAQDVVVKLPASLQDRIHRIMKAGLRKRNLALGGFGIGVSVTILESVCTGQVYLPVLVMMIKSGQSLLRSVLYLALYNAIFVLPLAVALTLTCRGIGTPALLEWSRRNVLLGKILMGLFFLAMAGAMVATR